MIIFSYSKDPKKVFEKIKTEIRNLKENGLDENSFNRVKNKIYGRLITSYNSPAQIGRIFMRDYMNDIISFDYINEWNNITIEEANEMIKDKFIEEKMILSIVNPK